MAIVAEGGVRMAGKAGFTAPAGFHAMGLLNEGAVVIARWIVFMADYAVDTIDMAVHTFAVISAGRHAMAFKPGAVMVDIFCGFHCDSGGARKYYSKYYQ